MHAILDEIENSTPPKEAGIVVTVSNSEKIFSTGFDLDFMKRMKGEIFECMAAYAHLSARLLTFPMATVAAINGHAYAGGLLWALMHDFRTMRADYGYCCLSEVNIGVPIPEPFAQMVKHTMNP